MARATGVALMLWERGRWAYFGGGVVVSDVPFLLFSAPFFSTCFFPPVVLDSVTFGALSVLPPVACANTTAAASRDANNSFVIVDSP